MELSNTAANNWLNFGGKTHQKCYMLVELSGTVQQLPATEARMRVEESGKG
jgi:hypothetical protein